MSADNSTLLFAPWEIYPAFFRLVIFSKSTFSKNSFGSTIRVSNSLDTEQAKILPDLGQSCLQRLSADDTR